jgi:GntR family transcriptional regulator
MVTTKSLHGGLAGVNPRDVIDKSSPIPLHYQLERFLREGIEGGRFPANESLPTEQELQDFFNLSRTPIRQALSKLVTAGLVERRRSLGTVVISRPFEENLVTLSSFTEEVLRKGSVPQTRLLEFEERPADLDDEQRLNLPHEARVYHVRRLRFIDGQPMGIIESHLPVDIFEGLQPDMFALEGLRQSVYNLLETVYHLRLVRAVEVIHAVNLEEEDARLLALPPRSAVLQRTRTTYDSNGRPVASERGLYHVRYQIEWDGREVKQFARSVDPLNGMP